MRESHPLAMIHDAVLEVLADRDDVVVFGAQAVNAYVGEARMTQDVDVLSTHASQLAEEIRQTLAEKFHIAVRIRTLSGEHGYRVYQIRQPKNRHLVDVRPVAALPPSRRIGRLLVPVPAELIASKVIAYVQRRDHPKAGTDWRDVAVLLLAFPDLKALRGPVQEALTRHGGSPSVLAAWSEIVHQQIVADDED